MMMLFAGFLLSCAGGAFGAAFFKKRVELTLPCSFMGNVLLLYIAFMCDMPLTGVLGIFIFNLLLLLAAVIKASRDFEEFRKRFLTPGLLAYVLWSVLFYLMNHQRLFCYWDEFTHWGLAAKAVYMYNLLPCEMPEVLNFPSYPPAMPLLQYFYLTAQMGFSESAVLFASSQFIASFFPLALWKNSFADWKENVFTFTILPLVPQAFIAFFYSTYVDGILAMTTGYALILLFGFRRLRPGNMFYLGLTLFFLAMIKASGTGLAYLILFALLIKVFECRREMSRSTAVSLLLPPAGVLFAQFSWKYLISANHCPVSFSGSRITPAALWDAAVNNIPAHTYQVFFNWVKKFTLNQPWSPEFYEYAPGALISVLFFAVIGFLMAKNCKREYLRHNLRLLSVLGVIFTTLFAVTLLIYYIFDFALFEALILASFERYINTMVLAFYFALLVLGHRAAGKEPHIELKFDLLLCFALPVFYFCFRLHVLAVQLTQSPYINWILGLFYLMLVVVRHIAAYRGKQTFMRFNLYIFLLMLPCIMLPQIYICTNRTVRRDYDFIRGSAAFAAARFREHRRSPDRIVTIDQANHGMNYYLMRYECFPYSKPYPWSIGGKQYSEDVWSVKKSAGEFAADVQNMDLLYLHKANKNFRENYRQSFADPEKIFPGRFYTSGYDGKLHLLKCERADLDFNEYNFLIPPENLWGSVSHTRGKLTCRLTSANKRYIPLYLRHLELFDSAVFRDITIYGRVSGGDVQLRITGKDNVSVSCTLAASQGEFCHDFKLPPQPLGKFKVELTGKKNSVVTIERIVFDTH